MRTVPVTASRNYEVQIGSGLLPGLGEAARKLTKAKKAAIISETNVWPLYGGVAEKSMNGAGFETVSFVFPAGEASKSGETYLQLVNFLAENQLTRSDLIIALGGGVVGDLAGFAAATYLRGIRFIQVPTTLLAAVDSSVGGKTAIDLPAGKNLCGAFYQPSLVLCDIDTLNTLPPDIFRDGCAEVIKYGILYDPDLFEHLRTRGMEFDREAVITRCVELKRDVVAEDEFDTGARMRLNLGHTVGHGIEAQSHFGISHGSAVAIGTAIVTRAAAVCGICSEETRNTVLEVLETFGLPMSCDYSAEDLYRSALSDKKRSGGTVNLIIPERVGFCRIAPTPVSEIQSFIKAGL
ncbi:MAG: 3-dehydroquinate synthase [Oscillospiraceae bacterium]|nr:3-dehydroquinate synthase [Oscillospiraceae bacterium]